MAQCFPFSIWIDIFCLQIHDGHDENSTLLGKYCGGQDQFPNPCITSQYNFLWLKFKTDSSISNRGFFANYSSISIGEFESHFHCVMQGTLVGKHKFNSGHFCEKCRFDLEHLCKKNIALVQNTLIWITKFNSGCFYGETRSVQDKWDETKVSTRTFFWGTQINSGHFCGITHLI